MPAEREPINSQVGISRNKILRGYFQVASQKSLFSLLMSLFRFFLATAEPYTVMLYYSKGKAVRPVQEPLNTLRGFPKQVSANQLVTRCRVRIKTEARKLFLINQKLLMDISDNNMMIAMNATLCYTAQSGYLSLKFIHCYRLATSRPSKGIFKRRSHEREQHKS